MDFALKVALSFLVGGAYVSLIIWLSEKLGSKIGGAVAGLPSTILVGLIFISITEGQQAAKEATSIVPFMFIATLIYACVFMYSAKRFTYWQSLLASLVASLAWLIASLFIRQLSVVDFLWTVVIALSGLLIFRYFFRNYNTVLPHKIPISQKIYLLRFFIGGVVIASSLIAARLLGPIWGGIISCFPGVLGSVLCLFLNNTQGQKFLKGFIRRLPLSYISSLLFLIVIYVTITNWPTIISFSVGLATSLLYAYLLVAHKDTEKL